VLEVTHGSILDLKLMKRGLYQIKIKYFVRSANVLLVVVEILIAVAD
jgi:hypothetical protein